MIFGKILSSKSPIRWWEVTLIVVGLTLGFVPLEYLFFSSFLAITQPIQSRILGGLFLASPLMFATLAAIGDYWFVRVLCRRSDLWPGWAIGASLLLFAVQVALSLLMLLISFAPYMSCG